MTDDVYLATPCALAGSPSWCAAIILYTRHYNTNCRTPLHVYSTITTFNYLMNSKRNKICTIHYTNSAVKQFCYLSQHKCVDFLYGKAQNSVHLNILMTVQHLNKSVYVVCGTQTVQNMIARRSVQQRPFLLLRIFSFHVYKGFCLWPQDVGFT